MRGKNKCYAHGRNAGPGKGHTATPGSLYSKYLSPAEWVAIPDILAEMGTLESEVVAATVFQMRLQGLLLRWVEGEEMLGPLKDLITTKVVDAEEQKTSREIKGKQIDDKKAAKSQHAEERIIRRTPDLLHLTVRNLDLIRRLKETHQNLRLGEVDALQAQLERQVERAGEEGEAA